MARLREIRASFDREGIVVYQAFSPAIADAALRSQRFVEPFSMGRMTWIKPSFLWLMHRSNWGLKSGQERTLAVTITRSGWEQALGQGVLTVYEERVFRSKTDWDRQFQSASVHIQWDTERNLRGAGLGQYSIKVGLSRQVIREYVENWTLRIEDLTPKVAKMRDLLRSGRADEAKRHLPSERLYPISEPLAHRLFIG
jgi:hypothetical protein